VNELTLHDVKGHGIPTPLIVTVVLAAAAIMWAAPRAARGDYRDLLTAFIILQSLWIVLFWRMGVYMFMAYVIAEGFLVNYFNGLSELNLVKDVFVSLLFLTVAVMLVMRHRAPFPRLGWVLPFAGFAFIYIAEIFNPNLPTVLVGLVGIRVTLFYFLLMPVAYWFFDSTERVVKFFLFMVAVSIPVAAFGIVQYFKGPAWMMSISPGFERAVFYAVSTDAGGVDSWKFRTFSTFVHTGAFSQYLALMMLVTAALWGLFRVSWQRMVVGAILMLQFFALLTTGGRASFFVFFACVGMWWFFQRGSLRLAPAVVLLPVFFYGATLLLGTGFLDRFSTLLDPQVVENRNVPLMVGWLQESMKTDWAGMGAGYASLASRHVAETALNIGVVENGLAKMRIEAGIPGLILYVIFLVSFGFTCARQAFRVPDPRVRWFATPVAAFVVLNIMLVPIGTPFDVSPTNVYIWFLAGFLGRATTLASDDRPQSAQTGSS
jgi:hypothetical protein